MKSATTGWLNKVPQVTLSFWIIKILSTTVGETGAEGARARIKSLETAWDSAEAGIKPRAAGDWHVVDKAIDHALDALRAKDPQQSECKARMKELLNAFDSMKSQ